MTLVYATAVDDIAFMVSDTLLTSERDRDDPSVNRTHALKIHILNGNTAVAFAGNADTALRLIGKLNIDQINDPTADVLGRLSEGCRRASMEAQSPGDEIEFLVMQLGLEGRKLARIVKDSIFECERAYIGDADEYKRMMGLRVAYTPPTHQLVQQPDGSFKEVPFEANPGEIEFHEISSAMQALARCATTPTADEGLL